MAKKPRPNAGRPMQNQKKRDSSTWLLLGGLALVAIAVLVLVWIALTPQRGNGGPPKLQVNTERLELGKQVLGKTVHASFDVKNTGPGTLTLSVPASVTVLEGC